MKFYPRTEFQCGACASVVWSTPKDEGVVLVRCTNRGCENHGKVFLVDVPELEGVEVKEVMLQKS